MSQSGVEQARRQLELLRSILARVDGDAPPARAEIEQALETVCAELLALEAGIQMAKRPSAGAARSGRRARAPARASRRSDADDPAILVGELRAVVAELRTKAASGDAAWSGFVLPRRRPPHGATPRRRRRPPPLDLSAAPARFA